MNFLTSLPGLTRYPPSRYPAGVDHWQAHLTCGDFQRMARAIEDLGFDAIIVGEHIALPVDSLPNMGAPWPHGFTAMAFIAGATSSIKVNSMVIVLPYHQPVEFAKAISTLDLLSGGRVMVNFGVGWAPTEFRALGVPFERRGRVTDEYIRAMKVLWSEDRPTFEGEFVEFSDIVFEPKPVQRPHPPIWFGGRSMAAFRRAAREGDGWAPYGDRYGKGPWFEGPEQLPELLAEVQEMRSRAGNPRPFDVFVFPTPPESPHLPESPDQIVDEIGRLAELGVTWTTVSRPNAQERSLEEYLDNQQWVAEQIVAACR